jgi:hypothetical protein
MELMLFILSLTLIADIILLVPATYWALIFIPIPLYLLYLIRVMSTPLINEKKVKGMSLGDGLNLADPSNPIKMPVILDDNALNLGMLFMGSPGSGKTVAAARIKQHFVNTRENSGFAYFEGKGDFDIYQMDVAAGVNPDYFFSSELESSDTMNLISGDVSNVIDYLSRILVGSESEYYGAAQVAAIRKTLPLLMALPVPVNLKDYWTLLTVDEAAQHVILQAEEIGCDPDVVSIAKDYFGFNLQDPKDFNSHQKERLNEINGMLNKLYPFVSGFLSERLNSYNPTLDLAKAVKENKRLYFHLPLTEMSYAIATIVTEQMGGIAKSRQLDTDKNFNSFPMLFDDWGAFFYDNFGPITARCRSAAMPVSFFFQSRGQTDSVKSGGIFTTEITDNIGAFVSLRINGADTAKWVSSQFGEYEAFVMSKSDSTISQGESMQINEKPRVRPDELRDLNKGECFINIFVTGDKGAMSNRRYKARFPMPEIVNPLPPKWPVIESNSNNDVEGLGLWSQFMDIDKIAELKQSIVNDALDESSKNSESESSQEFGEVDFL